MTQEQLKKGNELISEIGKTQQVIENLEGLLNRNQSINSPDYMQATVDRKDGHGVLSIDFRISPKNMVILAQLELSDKKSELKKLEKELENL